MRMLDLRNNPKVIEVNYDFNFRLPDFPKRNNPWARMPNGDAKGLLNTLLNTLPVNDLFYSDVRYLEYQANHDTYYFIFYRDQEHILAWTKRYETKVKYLLRLWPTGNLTIVNWK